MEHESLRMEEVTNAIIKIFNPLTPRMKGQKRTNHDVRLLPHNSHFESKK